MNRISVWAVLMLFVMGVQTSAAQDCDRTCLKNTMTTYLNALVAQDPSKAPLAANVRFTEDAKELKVGDGFWKKATKLGDYRQDFIDVKEQVIASWVIVEESGRPAKLTARLKVANGRITEIETLVSPAGERVSGGATMVRFLFAASGDSAPRTAWFAATPPDTTSAVSPPLRSSSRDVRSTRQSTTAALIPAAMSSMR